MRSRHNFLILILFVFLSVNLFAAGYEFEMGKWMKEWTVCGPIHLESPKDNELDQQHIPGFETDYLAGIGGEENPDITAGTVISVNGEKLAFKEIVAPDSVIVLDDFVSTDENVCAYAYREIFAEKEQICYLSVACNDGGRVWFNGMLVWDEARPGGLNPDEGLVPVVIKKGKNTLLLKVEELGNVWAFCTRFLSFDSDLGAGSFFTVLTMDAKPVLHFKYDKRNLASLFKENLVTITPKFAPESVIWQGKLETEQDMVLSVPTERYAEFKLSITAQFIDGQLFQESHTFSAGNRQVFELFNDRKTKYAIVVDNNASESEQWAARELQHWLNKVSGAFFPIVNQFKESIPSIVVGCHPDVLKMFPDDMHKSEALSEAFTYKNMGPHVFIWGGSQRGTMYGVLSFLENELGLRWYTPQVTNVPEKDKYEFTYLYNHESPGIRVRNDFYYEAFDPVWAARNRVNGAMGSRKQPGGVEGYWAVHTFYRFMPPTEFYDEHPEYYSLIDGKRVHDHAQLCLTNPDVFKIVTNRLKQAMRDNPDCLIYSVSQNDWRNPCQCENCQKIARKEESEAGPLIWFVNKIAKEIEKEFPDKYVGTLAYQYTRKPCKNIKPRENVVIRLCSIECCFSHDFKSCSLNQSFMDDLQGWSAIAPHMYIWDYVVNFGHYIMPYPNFGVLQENIKTFQENNAIGIMEQAAYQSRGGEFAELRAYLISKLLWNPDCDVETVVNDFIYGYYGRSGQFIREYYDLLQGLVTPLTHIHLFMKPEDKIFTESFIIQAGEIFDRAEVIADNQDVLERVEMARLPILYLKCLYFPQQSKHDGSYTRFCEIVEREGITHYAERHQLRSKEFHDLMDSIE